MIGADGTCVSMSDVPELFEEFGRRAGRYRFARYPLARVCVAFNLKTMIMTGHEIGGYTTSEISLLKRRLPKFEAGDVLVLDRHYAGANLYVEYQRAGVNFISRAHQKLQIERLKVAQVFDTGDMLVQMPVNAQHRKMDPTLPEAVEVRMIQTQAVQRQQ